MKSQMRWLQYYSVKGIMMINRIMIRVGVSFWIKRSKDDWYICSSLRCLFWNSGDFFMKTRACLKKAFCKMCVTICGRFCPDEGVVAGYDNRIRVKYTAKWGVQIAGMIFQTRSRAWTVTGIHFTNRKQQGGVDNRKGFVKGWRELACLELIKSEQIWR